MTIKAPKIPYPPKTQYPPSKPDQYIIVKTNKINVNICSSKYVSISFAEIMELRSQIKENDDEINIRIDAQALSDDYGSGCSCYAEVSDVYFEWHEKKQDPQYQKNIEKYQESLKKYSLSKSLYDDKLYQYKKDMKTYSKEIKAAYRLEKMKAEKARLEDLIARAEKKK